MKTFVLLVLLQVTFIFAIHPWNNHHLKDFKPKKQVLNPTPKFMETGKEAFHLHHAIEWEVNSHEVDLDEEVLNRFHLFHQKRAEVSHPNVILKASIHTSGKFVTPRTAEDEAYEMTIDEHSIKINAHTHNGVAHAITTLIQLLETEQHENGDILYVIPNYPIRIKDEPKFSYRGVLLDTSRHYFTQTDIQTVIGWASEAKLNTLHLHLTDSQAWPIVIDQYPELTKVGAYNDKTKVYTRHQVREMVKFGKAVGVNLIPEIDCPAHAPINYGGNNGIIQNYGEIVQCWGLEYDNPDYSVEMPSGQWNMTNPNTVKILEDVWTQLNEDFTSDILHLGMDELNKNCACVGTEFDINTDECTDYVTGVFQEFAEEIVTTVQAATDKTVMVWQDSLFEYGIELPNPANSIVQLWNWKPDDVEQQEKIIEMCKAGTKFVYSQWDTYYLDCGGTNSCLASLTWCPYVTWYSIYTSSITQVPDECIDSIIGAEGTLWSEVATGDTMAAKLLPRIWAIGERTWANPATADKAASLAGAEIWIEYLPTIRTKTQQYIDWDIGVRPVNTEYCFVNDHQAEFCNHWTMSFYEAQCLLEHGMVKDSQGACNKCGEGTFALKHGLGCSSCSEHLGSAHCCNKDGTYGECPIGINCNQNKFCNEYEGYKEFKFKRI